MSRYYGSIVEPLQCRLTKVCLVGVCGDGVATAKEDCDGGQGCSDTCTCDGTDYVPLLPRDSNCGLVSKVDCELGEYEVQAPTWSSERVCAPITQCLATEWEKRSPNTFRDRVCEAITVCSELEYTVTAATTTSDAECATLTVCGSSQFASVVATATSDRSCSSLTECQEGEYQSRAPQANADRQCGIIDTCVVGEEFEVGASLVTPFAAVCSLEE